jgi:hypothetical protein
MIKLVFVFMFIFAGCGEVATTKTIPNSSLSDSVNTSSNAVDFPTAPTSCGDDCPPSFLPPG